MRVAFHFVEDETLRWPRPLVEFIQFIQPVFREDEQTKVFVGTVLFDRPARVRERTDTGETERTDPETLAFVLERWLNPDRERLSTLVPAAAGALRSFAVFAVLAETLTVSSAHAICRHLQSVEGYLGAREVDNSDPVDRAIYALVPLARIRRESVAVFWDGLTPDSRDESLLHAIDAANVGAVSFESLGGRFSIFDSCHNPKADARRAAWARGMSEHFAYLVESIVGTLGDAAPDLADKLWAALDTLTRAETAEQYAQVAVTCRRIIEYCADSVFPPTDADDSPRKLGSHQYRNRLLAFADAERCSNTDIDLIAASTRTLAEQLERLENAVNKGVHNEIAYAACRRCLIRTLICLDDIASLRSRPFEIRIRPDLDLMRRILGVGEGPNSSAD